MRTLYCYTIGLMLFFNQQLKAKTFIFDLDGVLVKTDKSAVIRDFGLRDISNYYSHFKIPHQKIGIQLKEKFFEIQDKVSSLIMPEAMQNYHEAYDEFGQRLPFFMCAWLDGSLDGHFIISAMSDAMEQHGEWFEHPSERILVTKLTRMLFTPERFVATRKVSRKGIRYIKHLRRQGHNVYVLSNWDSRSFTLMAQRNPKLFHHLNGVIISGDIKSLKPEQQSFTTIVDRYGLNPEDCIFVDDQPENISAALKTNMDTIQVQKKGFRQKADFRMIAKNSKQIIHQQR